MVGFSPLHTAPTSKVKTGRNLVMHLEGQFRRGSSSLQQCDAAISINIPKICVVKQLVTLFQTYSSQYSAIRQRIYTVAGNGSFAVLKRPKSIAVDGTGNIFIADSEHHRIRMVTAAGVISTLAGSGIQGFSGDRGDATKARLQFPSGIALDGIGNVYISDTFNDRIRKIALSGNKFITTIAGGAQPAFVGENIPAIGALLNNPRGLAIDKFGNIFIADNGNHRIRKIAVPSMVITTVAGS